MADEKSFKVGDRVRRRGGHQRGTVKGFNLSGKVFVFWDGYNDTKGAGMYEPEELEQANVSMKDIIDFILNQKQVRL